MNDTVPRPSFVLPRGGLLSALLLTLMLLLSSVGNFRAAGDDRLTEAGNRAIAAFAVARTINAVVSVIQETQVGVSLGINTTIEPGQILDPLNDLIERFSVAALVAATLLWSLKLVGEFIVVPWVPLVLGALLAARFAIYRYRPGAELENLLARLIRIGIVVWSFAALTPWVISAVHDSSAVQTRYQQATDDFDRAGEQLRGIVDIDSPWNIDRGRIRDRMQEEMLRDTILIATAGVCTGQVNGLSVLQLGEYAFGRPSRITARVSLGAGKVVDIEREVELGGPIHSKGVLILTSFLVSHYLPDQPLSLHASLVFEQSYSGVEGDSASAAELCALLSALAETPIKQSMAITGSVNQFGQIQPIGGVNEKIEGFFDLCNRRGLTGEQGVLIPSSNVKHLMLRRDVIDAVEQGRFNIYPVESVDQCLELLTGTAAGAPSSAGEFPEGSVNGRVRARLIDMAQKRRAFTDSGKQEGAS